MMYFLYDYDWPTAEEIEKGIAKLNDAGECIEAKVKLIVTENSQQAYEAFLDGDGEFIDYVVCEPPDRRDCIVFPFNSRK